MGFQVAAQTVADPEGLDFRSGKASHAYRPSPSFLHEPRWGASTGAAFLLENIDRDGFGLDAERLR